MGRLAQVTVTCGTEFEGDVYEDGTATHIRFTLGSSHLLLRQKACAALGMADRVGLRMEYLGPDERWFALVDSDDMEDAVEFARHPGPPEALLGYCEPEPEPEPYEPPSWTTSRQQHRPRGEKKLTIRLVMPGEVLNQQPRGTTSMPEMMRQQGNRPGHHHHHQADAVPMHDQDGRQLSPRSLGAQGNVVVLEATVQGWHAQDFQDVVPGMTMPTSTATSPAEE